MEVAGSSGHAVQHAPTPTQRATIPRPIMVENLDQMLTLINVIEILGPMDIVAASPTTTTGLWLHLLVQPAAAPD